MVFRFGRFAFDDRTALLTRGDRPLALEPQPARALALLLSRAGEVVTREELRAHLWGGDTHVDFDRGLAYCIGELRAALGDSADNPRFVQTLPRRGFMFIAPVDARNAGAAPDPLATRPSPAAATAGAPDGEPAATPARMTGTSVDGKRRPLVAAAAVALAIVAFAAAFMNRGRATSAPRRPIIAVALFENESGDAAHTRVVAGLSDVIVEPADRDRPLTHRRQRASCGGRATPATRAVATQTGAAYLVAGQLQTKDGRLSLLVHLIRLDDGTHVWVNRIARPAGDPLEALDTDVAQQVETAIRRVVLHEGTQSGRTSDKT